MNPLPKWSLFLMVPLFLLLRTRFCYFWFRMCSHCPSKFPLLHLLFLQSVFCSYLCVLSFLIFSYLFLMVPYLFPYFLFTCVYFCLCLVTLVVCTYLIYLFLFVSFLWHLSFTLLVGLCRETKGVSLPLPLCPFGAGAAGATDCNCFVRKNMLQLATCCTHLQFLPCNPQTCLCSLWGS